jgi:hypothetical protein
MFFLATEIIAQSDSITKKNQIGFGLGLYQAKIKNALVSDFGHKGTQIPAIQISYKRISKSNFHNLQITYTNLKLYSPYRQNYTTDLRPTLAYSYLRKLIDPTQQFSLYLGLTVFGYASFRDVRFNNEDIANNYNTEYTSMLSVSSMATYKIEKNLFEVQANWGGVSFNQRTGYANKVAAETKWQLQSFSNFNEYSLRMAYTRAVSKKINLRIEYNFQFHSFIKPEYLGYLSNCLTISSSFKF